MDVGMTSRAIKGSQALRRWLPGEGGLIAAAFALGLNLGLALLAIALLVIAAPAPGSENVWLVVTLAVLAVFAYAVEVRLKRQARPGYEAAGVFFNAGIVLAVLALYFAGPLVALLVWWIPDGISRVLLRREPIASPGHVATVSGYALAALAGSAIVGEPAVGTVSPVEVIAAGLVMYSVNFAVTCLAFAPFYECQRPLGLIRNEFLATLPAFLPLLAVAAISAALVPVIGEFALVPLAGAIFIPQAVIGALTRYRSAATLAPEEATRAYSAAIADVMGLPRRERRALTLASAVRPSEPKGTLRALGHELAAGVIGLGAGQGGHAASSSIAAFLIADRSRERFDGADWPSGCALLEPAPLSSRILAVARTWSELTAAGGPRLSHESALVRLDWRAGAEFDPAVVAAAEQVVAEEGALVRASDFAPQLHRVLPSGSARRRILAFSYRLRPATGWRVWRAFGSA